MLIKKTEPMALIRLESRRIKTNSLRKQSTQVQEWVVAVLFEAPVPSPQAQPSSQAACLAGNRNSDQPLGNLASKIQKLATR
jgi:hypothetical protein